MAGDAESGVHIVGTVLTPQATLKRGVLTLDAAGNVTCAACDCGPEGDALVLDCPSVVVSPGLLNLHDHLGYAGTPPLPHPGTLYQHRSDWRLGQNGHEPLAFSGGATTVEVLAHELRMVLGGATSIVGAGGRRGLLRNLDVAGLSEGLLPGVIRAETFPLDDARSAADSAHCLFGSKPDTPESIALATAYVPHLGEGTNQRAADELTCALGSLGQVGPRSAVVHAMALDRHGASELARLGASVVWSPRSNLDLYGATAPVALLSSLGVRIALGTDWLASGSMNLLRELACVRAYDERVLGGRFSPAARWRMVTADAAWALGLERRVGELSAGSAGDVTLFTERADPHASVVDAHVADVRLVLRQGRPLYGDVELVQAFSRKAGCDELRVCEQQRLVCLEETGSTLDALVTAAQAVYPLFACGVPESEPRCEALVERECPFGEAECLPPGPLARPIDSDDDGVEDARDLCPRLWDTEQSDADGDGLGDACDACPVANPGGGPCPSTIAALRAPSSRLPLGSAISLHDVRVTAVRAAGARGYYAEDGDHAPYSGIFVYTGSKAPGVQAGELVTVRGYFDRYQGTDELTRAELVARRASPHDHEPLRVALAELVDGAPRPDAWASQLVLVAGLEVVDANPDSPNDYDETGLLGGLRLDDLLDDELDNVFPIGARFAWVRGISGSSFSHRKLWPRGPSDWALE